MLSPGIIVLGVSLGLQTWATVLAARMAFRRSQRAWLWLALAIVLMASRRAVSLMRALQQELPPDLGAESIALVISVSMVVCLLLLDRGEAGAVTASTSLQRIDRIAVALGLVAILANAAVAWAVYRSTSSTVREQLTAFAAVVARSLQQLADDKPVEEVGELLLDGWRRGGYSSSGSYLCLVDATGRLRLNTRNPQAVGEDVRQGALPGAVEQTLGALLRSRRDHSGRYVTPSGEHQIAAFVHLAKSGGMLAVHLPESVVVHHVRATAGPALSGFLIVGFLLFPICILLLHWAFQHSERHVSAVDRARRESESRYRALFQGSTDAIVVYDENGVVLDSNPKATALLRRLGGESAPRLPRLAVDPGVEAWPRPGEIPDSAQGTPLSAKLAFGDGEEASLEVMHTRIELGGRSLVAASLRDVTARVELQMRLQRAARMEAVGQLAGGIAHDFNNLLTVALGHCDLLLEAHRDPEVSGAVAPIREAAERGAGLVRQLLAFSKQQILLPRALDLNRLVMDMRSLVRPLLPEDIVLSVHLAPDLPAVRADAAQLQQVLLNLLLNARDAMPRGGNLRLSTKEATVESDRGGQLELKPGRYVELTVADDGIGMANDVASRVFEPFFTTKDPAKGTGLGLATAHGIIRQSGGAMEVTSHPERGATFVVLLPCSMELDSVESASSQLRREPAGGTPVLLVEDDAAVRALVLETLRSLGYAVEVATDAESALEVAENMDREPQLLVSDVVMPGGSGVDLAQRLRRLFPGMAVLLTSGYSPEALLRRGLESQYRLLAKPFSREQLAESARQALMAPDRLSPGAGAPLGG